MNLVIGGLVLFVIGLVIQALTKGVLDTLGWIAAVVGIVAAIVGAVMLISGRRA